MEHIKFLFILRAQDSGGIQFHIWTNFLQPMYGEFLKYVLAERNGSAAPSRKCKALHQAASGIAVLRIEIRIIL
jgi:hypothetical protein